MRLKGHTTSVPFYSIVHCSLLVVPRGQILETLFTKISEAHACHYAPLKPTVTFAANSTKSFGQIGSYAVADIEGDYDRVAVVTLDPVLDLKAASPLAEHFLAQRGADIAVNASAVERLGAQSLQVILSAIATWQADGHAIELKDPSEAFLDGLQLFGLDAERIFKPHATA